MPHEVIMPALGMAQDSGLIVAWHKAAGDAVAAGDVLFEVETDKATMEVEAQVAGFLARVRAAAGDSVPVGEVIAVIGDSAEEESPPEAAPEPDALPEGHGVIMPALGMAQDSGLIVAWHKAPGDAVAAADVLFEVETDKSTVEVEAGADGYVAALLAEAGQEAPVGEVIAVITADKPEAPQQRSRSAGATPDAASASASASAAKVPGNTPVKAPEARAPAPTDGRILASPKARRLALEQGLDLQRLVEEGHPQPYHAADIEVLKSLGPSKVAAPVAAAQTRRLTADLPEDGFAAFATWARDGVGLDDAQALLAGLAAAGLGRDRATVAVEAQGDRQVYAVPHGPLSAIDRADAAPDLILRDLRLSRIASVALGAEDAPVLTLTPAGDGLTITLECSADQLDATAALTLLSEFAGRMEQPLRHLL